MYDKGRALNFRFFFYSLYFYSDVRGSAPAYMWWEESLFLPSHWVWRQWTCSHHTPGWGWKPRQNEWEQTGDPRSRMNAHDTLLTNYESICRMSQHVNDIDICCCIKHKFIHNELNYTFFICPQRETCSLHKVPPRTDGIFIFNILFRFVFSLIHLFSYFMLFLLESIQFLSF